MTNYTSTEAHLRQTSSYKIAKDALGFMRDDLVLRYLDTTDPYYSPLGKAQELAVRDELRDRGITIPN